MTFEILKKVIEMNNIPENVRLRQDCGWECCATELNGVWYNAKRNEIQFTQNGKREFDDENEFSDIPSEIRYSDNRSEWALVYYDDENGRKMILTGEGGGK